MTPNWEAFREAVVLMTIAGPYMFAVLALFALVITLLSRVKDPTN